MMIIDTFPFNKDFVALEIRFEELKNSVDLFVASEATFTHSGLHKELHLTKALNLQKKMGSKLKILATNRKPFSKSPRTREMLQRQEITRFLRSIRLSPTDLIIHSDCDEIPRAEVIDFLSDDRKPVDAILELDNYANYLNARDGIWTRGRIQSFGKFRSVQHMRADIFIHSAYHQRRHPLPLMRLTDFWSPKRFPLNKFPEWVEVKKLQVIRNGGWHFNNLLDEDEILLKIMSSCHVEWNTEIVRDNALKNYRNASDIYTGKEHEIVEIDESFPIYIQENREKFLKFIY
jgi:hypothetical protein